MEKTAGKELRAVSSMDSAAVRMVEPARRGVYISYTRVGVLVAVVLLLLVLVGVVVALYERWTLLFQTSKDSSTPKPREATPPSLTLPTSTVDPKLPWGKTRLPDDVVPYHYNIQLKIDLDIFRFIGSEDIFFTCVKETKLIIVHAVHLKIHTYSVFLLEQANQRSIPIVEQFPVPINQFYVLVLGELLIPGRKYTIRFNQFRGVISSDLKGLYRSSYKSSTGQTRYLAVTQMAVADARKVFPCFDEPAIKATFDMSIIRRPVYTAISNMPLMSSTPYEDDWIKDSFHTTPLMSTYLIALVVCDYEYTEIEGPNGLQIRVWAQPNKVNQTRHALNVAAKAYRFYLDFFKIPFIEPKSDHVAIPDFSGGAMENWGLITYRETSLLYDPEVSSFENMYLVTLVVCHEIAHMWFGNMVTMKWWTDLWLNEGFANMLMYYAMDALYPEWKVYDKQIVDNVLGVMVDDSFLTSHPIAIQINHPDEIGQYFDSVTYDKGLAILRMLNSFIGKESFQKALQMYIKQYKYKNAEMENLWGILMEAVDMSYDVATIMNTWTLQMGYPLVTINKLNHRIYRAEQSYFLLDSQKVNYANSPYRYKWYIPFTYKTKERLHTQTVWMNLSSAEIVVDNTEDSWIVGNINHNGFYRVNYDLEIWESLAEQLKRNHKILETSTRVTLISNAFSLARAEELSYDVALSISAYLKNEDDYTPWYTFDTCFAYLDTMMSNSDYYGLLQKYLLRQVSPLVSKLGWSTIGEIQTKYLRVHILRLAVMLGHKGASSYAFSLYQQWRNYGERILTDFKDIVYKVGVMEGGVEAWDFLWDVAKTTLVSTEIETIYSALAVAKEPWLLWRFLRWTIDPEKVRPQDVAIIFRAFKQTPLSRTIAFQFMQQHWDLILKRIGHDVFGIRGAIQAVTSYLNTEQELELLEKIFRKHPPSASFEHMVVMSFNVVKSNIKWMEKNEVSIAEWLQRNL